VRAPLAYRPAETQVQEEAIKDNIMFGMTRGEAIKHKARGDVDQIWTGTRTTHKITNQPIYSIAHPYSHCEKDGLPKLTEEAEADDPKH